MLYLKDRTDELTYYTIREVVGLTLQWACDNMGTKKKFKDLHYQVLTQGRPHNPYFGDYSVERNTIRIYRDNCPTVKEVIKTTIHEYTHFLQDLRGYSKLLDKVGYRNHPMEIEARGNEVLYSICWKHIKNKL